MFHGEEGARGGSPAAGLVEERSSWGQQRTTHSARCSSSDDDEGGLGRAFQRQAGAMDVLGACFACCLLLPAAWPCVRAASSPRASCSDGVQQQAPAGGGSWWCVVPAPRQPSPPQHNPATPRPPGRPQQLQRQEHHAGGPGRGAWLFRLGERAFAALAATRHGGVQHARQHRARQDGACWGCGEARWRGWRGCVLGLLHPTPTPTPACTHARRARLCPSTSGPTARVAPGPATWGPASCCTARSPAPRSSRRTSSRRWTRTS